MMRHFHSDGSPASPGEIFVFGSNLSGIHGAGAARAACLQYGAEWGVAEGMTGQSYALPTGLGVCMGMSLQDQLRNLVDCGECRTQGCIAGHCRKAKEQSMRVQAIELTEAKRKLLSVKADVKFIPGLEKPTLDETAKQLLDLYMLAAKISGSALLAGERCPPTDRESLYKIACSVLSGLGCLYFDATGQWPSICDVPNEATRSASHD